MSRKNQFQDRRIYNVKVYSERGEWAKKRKSAARRALAAIVLSFTLVVFTVMIGLQFINHTLKDRETPFFLPAASAEPERVSVTEAVPMAADGASVPEEKKTPADNGVAYEGDLELPVNGSTGYAPVELTMRALPEANSVAVKSVPSGRGFLVLGEEDDWWEIDFDGLTGWVRHADCMINLPDVIPSIRYDATNTYSSEFVSSRVEIPNISGLQLYPGRAFNERLGKDEFIVAVMYPMAKKINAAQKNALENGDSLIIYEGFRPYSVQALVAKELKSLANSDRHVYEGLNASPWNIGWFIAPGVSTHQTGCAIDAGLIKAELNYKITGKYRYLITISPDNYQFIYIMPSKIHELSAASILYAYPVQSGQTAPYSEGVEENGPCRNLQTYCSDAGLTPLASEWWHFDDLQTNRAAPGNSKGDYILEECRSVPPE